VKLRKHIIIAAVSILVGIIHILPSIYVPFRLGSEYKGIFPFQSADEEHYDVCIKKGMESSCFNRNNYLKEGLRDKKSTFPPFKSEYILGFFGRFTGLSISSYIVLLRFLLPIAAFYLFYAIFRSFGVSGNIAVFWSLVNLLAPYLIFGWIDPFSRPLYTVLAGKGVNLLWFEQYAMATLPWSRMVNPQFSGLFFLGAIICLVKITRSEKPWYWFLPTGILFYINFRLYFYFWSTLGAMLGLIFVLSVVCRNKKAIFPLGAIMAAGLIKGLPFALRILKSKNEALRDYAYTLSHSPIFSPGCFISIVIIVLGLLFIRHLKKEKGDIEIFFAAPLTFLISMNQNIITGKIVQPWHYELFTGAVLLTISISILMSRTDFLCVMINYFRKLNKKYPHFHPLIMAAVILDFFVIGMILFFYYFKLAPNMPDAMFYISVAAFLALLTALFIQGFIYLIFSSGRNTSGIISYLVVGACILIIFEGITRQSFIAARSEKRARPIQKYATAFKWLNDNTAPGSTVLASFSVSERIPLFTHNTVYLCKNAIHEYAGSKSERWNRALNYFYLTGHNTGQFGQKLDIWPYGYLFWGLQELKPEKDLYSFGNLDPVPLNKLKNLLVKYSDKCKNPILSVVEEYSLNYIFFNRSNWDIFIKDPAGLPFVKPAFEDGPIVIYRVVH
jgi:hypothetical protein